MSKLKTITLITIISLLVSCATKETIHKSDPNATHTVQPISEIKWEQLNPARGDKSPKAATLWGDRKGNEPTGFLVKFVDGFSSPPHIHNVTYRGMVISGNVHNNHQDAPDMWMPAGSFWTQPAGAVHITSAKGKENVAYIEIENSPYMVLPPEKAADNGERPVNVDKSNIVWLDDSNTNWIDVIHPRSGASPVKGPKIAFLWGTPQNEKLNGTLLKVPSGSTVSIVSLATSLHAITIQGEISYQIQDSAETKSLAPGSLFTSTGKFVHLVTCKSKEDCTLYARTKGRYLILVK